MPLRCQKLYCDLTRSFHRRAAFSILDATSISHLSLPTSTPKNPCSHCGQQHWSWSCPSRSEEEKLQDAVNYTIRRASPKKQVRLTLLNTVYRVTLTQDGPCYSAGYDLFADCTALNWVRVDIQEEYFPNI